MFNTFFKILNFFVAVFNTGCKMAVLNTSKSHMILNFEIDDETGAKLDALAAREHRSRRQQATKLLLDALEMIESDNLEEGTAGRAHPTTTDIIRGAVAASQPQPEGHN